MIEIAIVAISAGWPIEALAVRIWTLRNHTISSSNYITTIAISAVSIHITWLTQWIYGNALSVCGRWIVSIRTFNTRTTRRFKTVPIRALSVSSVCCCNGCLPWRNARDSLESVTIFTGSASSILTIIIFTCWRNRLATISEKVKTIHTFKASLTVRVSI